MKKLMVFLMIVAGCLAMTGCPEDGCPYGAGSSGTCRPGPLPE